MKYKIIIALCTFFVLPIFVHAEYADYGVTVDVSFDAEHVAHVDLSIPCTPYTSVYFYHDLRSFGATGVDVEYVGGSVDGSKQYIKDADENDDVEIGCAEDSKRAHFKYEIKSTISGSTHIYEFALPYASDYQYLKKYFIDVKIPPTLKLISSSQEPVSNSNGVAKFRYQFGNTDENTSGDFFRMALIKNPLPTGVVTYNLSGVELIGYERSIAKFRKLEKYVPQIEQLFKETLGVSLAQKKIHAIVTNVNKIPLFYEAGGVFIEPDIILFDDNGIVGATDFTLLQLFVHEVTHAISTADHSGDGRTFNAPWFSEGLAVFHEQYFLDKYLSSTVALAETSEVLGAYKKFAYDELVDQYNYGFDYSFDATSKRPVSDSYRHAGLVMYRLFFDDPQVFKKLNSYLAGIKPDYNCSSCDTDKIIANLEFVTGKTRQNILFPFKEGFGMADKYKVLFARNVDVATVKKIETEELKKVESYFGDDTPVSSPTTSPQSQKVEKTPKPTPSVTVKPVKPTPSPIATTSPEAVPEKVVEPSPVVSEVPSETAATTSPIKEKRGAFGWLWRLFGM